MSPEPPPLAAQLEAALRAQALSDVSVARLTPLAGGACQESFLVELSEGGVSRKMVLRGDAPVSLPDSISRAAEFPVIRAAAREGVPTPEARWFLEGLTRPGAGAYLMDWADGVAIGARVVRDKALASAREVLPDQLAAALAAIHRLNPATHPEILPSPPADPARDRLALLRGMLDAMPSPRPASELIFRWLSRSCPPPGEVVLVHGDFRTGNFLVTPSGLSAVLDWEFTHWGSPLEDIGWLCVRDWRFGANPLHAGGLTTRSAFCAAYTRESGRPVDPAHLRFWEVLGNLKWAVGAVYQGERYLSGAVRDLELLAIPRRAAEMEYEALCLIDRA